MVLTVTALKFMIKYVGWINQKICKGDNYIYTPTDACLDYACRKQRISSTS